MPRSRLTRFARCFTLFAVSVLLSVLPQANAAQVEAYLGQPFGVGKVTVAIDRSQPSIPLSDERFTVQSASGQVFYPAVKVAPMRRLLRRLLEVETPARVTIYFLFQGDAPLEVNVYAPTLTKMQVLPVHNPGSHKRLLNEWWKEYAQRWRDLTQDPELPPYVENFTTATLARRLGLPMPPSKRKWLPWQQNKLSIWDELFASEGHQLRIDQQLLSNRRQPTEAELAASVPSPMPWPRLEIDPAEIDQVNVEPLAQHVPQESLYIRFGNFTNYLWLRDLNRKWQGDLKNMLLRRGITRAAHVRLESQLSLRETALSKILGPQVIVDVAMVGLDAYTNEGASIGILFQAKNNFLLSTNLNSQRRESLKKHQGAKETEVDLGVGKASLIASPGGEVRSYYVQDGDFHLVTTSEALARRFLEAGQGQRSLAHSPGFLLARKRLPLTEQDDSIFTHLSSHFFQQLGSPYVWIENQRRIKVARRLKLWQLARLMAKSEGSPATDLKSLIAAGYLPTGFGQTTDGAKLLADDLGGVDSLRGRPGQFVPIADLDVKQVTAEEAEQYRRFSERFLKEVGRMPPVTVAIKRSAIDEPPPTSAATTKLDNDQQRNPDQANQGNANRRVGELLTAELLIEPRAKLKLGKLQEWLGPPSTTTIPPAQEDLIHFELVLEAALPLLGGDPEYHHLFGGIHDFTSPLIVREGTIQPGAAPAQFSRGYMGATPQAGLLQLFTGANPLATEEPQELENEMWMARQDDFLLLSLKQNVVDTVLPQLTQVAAVRPAQLRFDVCDLRETDLANVVTAIGYTRARETSVAASRMMNTLANQLHVPRDQCQVLAEQLLGGGFVCALGGDYQLLEMPNSLPMWTSNALDAQNRFLLTVIPADFQLPLFSWLGAATGDAAMTDDAITAHLEVEMLDAPVETSGQAAIAPPPPAN